MLIGMFIYFIYSRHHSVMARQRRQMEAQSGQQK
jgi:hypothetical protein